MQTTIASPVSFTGVGLHSGKSARLTLKPAPANSGILFYRKDVIGQSPVVPARWDRVIVSPLNTRVQNADGVSVSTIEHLMAACAGTGLHNVLIEISGPEVPIMDGSSAPFVRGILRVGLRALRAPLELFEILEPIRVEQGDVWAQLEPAARPEMRFEIDFADPAIGHQALNMSLTNGNFVRELCDSRTFCRASDVEAMHEAGLALGGSMKNAVVVENDTVLTPGGLRHADEAVRHKMLDAVGDLYTAGLPILGRYTGHKAGHAVTNRLLHEMMSQPTHWRRIAAGDALRATLPGAGLCAHDLLEVA